MEERIVKMTITKPGGNASKNAKGYRVIIPPTWAKQLGVTDEDRSLKIIYDDEGRIVIEKLKEQ